MNVCRSSGTKRTACFSIDQFGTLPDPATMWTTWSVFSTMLSGNV
jgi:hypothetical protein